VKTEDLIVTLAVGEGKYLKAKGSLPLVPGTRATMSVRPEAIHVTVQESPESPTNGVSGLVAEIVYLGSRVRIGAAIRGEVVVWANLRDEEAEGPDVGTWVRLTWTPSAASVWADSSD
jgi:hypothetical protein